MKIFHFNYCLAQGGAERFVIDLANIQSLDNDVTLFILREDTSETTGFFVKEIGERVRYINLNISPGFKPSLIFKLNGILKAEKPDVVHCHLDLVNYFFPLSLKFHNRIKFFYTIHSHAIAEVKSFPEKIIRRFFFSHGYIVPVAISEETKASSETYYRMRNIRVIYNGRSFTGKSEFFDQVEKEVASLKPGHDTLVFCHLARYHKLKNREMLIKVFNRLKDEGYKVVLLMIGSGFDNEPGLQSLAKSHIHFLGAKPNVMDYLYVSDAFCLSSLTEGMPISLIEALACGCTPVCTPVGGIINTIQDGVTGFLSKSTSEDDFLDAVKRYIKEKDTIDRRKLVEYSYSNFSIERCMEKYIELYKEA